MTNTDQFDDGHDEGPEKRKKRGAGVYIIGALGLAAATGFGYWTATVPKQISELAAEKSAAPTPDAKVAETAAEAPAPVKQQQAAAPAEPPKVETPAPAAEAPAESPAVPDPVVAAAEPQTAPEPAPAPTVVAEPQPAPEKEPAPAPAETQVATAPAVDPAPQPTVSEQPPPQPAEQQAAAQVEPPPAPAQPEAPITEPTIEPPSFDTVRVEPTGEALIAGRAQPGTEVSVMHDGKMIGKTTANADGAFVLVPEKPLPPGAGSLTLETRIGDKTMTSTNAVAVAVKDQGKGDAMVAVVTPDQPAQVLQVPSSGDTSATSKKVVLDSVDYDDQGSIIFSGRSVPGNKVRLYVDNALAGEVKSDNDGKWTFNGQSAVPAGKHTLRADEIDSSGQVVSRVELPFLREEQQKVALAQPEVSDATGSEPAISVKTGEQAAVPQRIVIQPGNSLWRLSRVVYGKGTRYTVIYEANKDQIRNPDLIYPGQVFAVPVTP